MWNSKFLVFALVIGSISCPRLDAQKPPHCAQILYCLFNQEAAAAGPAGIHKYSRDVIDMVLPNQWTYGRSTSGQMETFMDERLGEDYAAKLADRLAKSEAMARTGSGKLVSEASVVKAFNDLMQEIGAPPSMRAGEASVHRFREHASSIKAFPALFSAARNGTNCNPGEAVFLLYLLLSDNGVLLEGNLDGAVAMMQSDGRQNGERSFGVAGTEIWSQNASGLLHSYSLRQTRNTSITLFNSVADTLGF